MRSLAAMIDGHEDLAEVIASFATDWLMPLTPGDGCAEEELVAAEARLGLRLPAALRTTYRLVGLREALVRTQDYLLEPSRLHLVDANRMLVFRIENQNVTQWAVPVDALDLDDPPVLFRLDELSTGDGGWARFMDRLSLACFEMVLSECLFSGANDLCDNRELDEAAVDELERGFGRLALPDYPLWAARDGSPVRWFGSGEVILREDGRQWLWARAKTPEALQRLRQALPGEWHENAVQQIDI